MAATKLADKIEITQISTEMEPTRKHIPDEDFVEILKLPRHVLALNKVVLRQFLARPIKAYKLKGASDEERERMIRQQHEDRFKALFALYAVPEILPADEQWRWLALGLAGEHFAGCKTLTRGLGGRSKPNLAKTREKKESLLRQFEAYMCQHRFSETAAAPKFFNKRRADCNEAGLRTLKSFKQAMRALRKENGISTEAMGS